MKMKKNVFRFGLCLGILLTLVASIAVMPRRALADSPSISYQTHVQTYGWQDVKKDGEMAGTSGQAKRLESIKIFVDGAGVSGGVSYKVHCQTHGWLNEVSDGAEAGTTGEGKRLEGIEIRLTGELSQLYDVQYRVHVQTYGWQNWVKNGEMAGTSGKAKRLEGIEIKLVAKDTSNFTTGISYQSHAQTYGWLNWMHDGDESGTTGEGKRLEAIKIGVNPSILGVSGGIRYRVHCQTFGWLGWAYNGAIAGTTGQAKRLEGIQIELTGDLANAYDVYYCTHVQSFGWQSWVKNGEVSGTTGKAKRLEAIRIKLVKKGAEAPADIVDATSTPIMGQSQATQADCVKHFKSISTYPADVYKNYGAPTIEDFVKILFEEAQAEGVRADVVYAQAMLETNYLRFGGDVKPEQCNFAGIGATGGGEPGHTFKDVRQGLRVQVQHLKAYASKDALNQELVDPRFKYVTRGIAPTLGGLSQHWAVGSTYGHDINVIVEAVDALS